MNRGFFRSFLAVGVLFGLARTVPAREAVHTFTILQLNDVYDVFPVPAAGGGDAREGGLAYVRTLAQQERAKGPVLFLHAGDFLSPSLLSQKLKHKGGQMIVAMNGLGLDLATFGNHEFDLGCAVLADRIKESRFPFVSSNVDLPPAMALPAGRVADHRVIEIAGLRVGFFGLTVPQHPVPGCGGESITFRDPLDAARRAVAALEQEKVDLIIGLTHLRVADDEALAAALPNVDLIVGGHEHEVIVTLAGRTLITKAGANATGLGRIGVRAVKAKSGWVVEKSWERIPVDPAILPADGEMVARLAPYQKELEAFARVIGRTEVPLDIREEVVREGESSLGDFLADLMRTSVGADVALLNGGSFRDDRVIPAGPLTLADLYTMLPFENEILVVRVTGQQLWEALENGVSLAGQAAGRFPQVSGLRFTFDPQAPVGNRVLSVRIGDAPLEPDRSYRLAATDFLVQRGSIDGYTLPQEIESRGGHLTEMLESALAQAPIRAAIDGRIQAGRRVPDASAP